MTDNSKHEQDEAAKHVERFDKLKSERGQWESHWEEVAYYTIPRKEDILSRNEPGNKRGIELYDTTQQQAAELLAAALHGMMTNPSNQWFQLTTGDEVLDRMDDVRSWCQDSARRMLTVMNASNFQPECHEFFLDQTWCGTSGMTVEEDDISILNFKTWHISEYLIDENNRGLVDTVYRSFEWDARKLVQEYGEKNVGEKVKKAYKEKKFDEKFKVIVCVYPRSDEEKKDRAGVYGYAFASKHILVGGDNQNQHLILKESGYQENPWIVARWSKLCHEKYGRSPAMKTLPDAKMVNEMSKTILEGAQKAVNPPVAVPHESYILPLRLKANGINYRNAGGVDDKIEPIFNDTRIDFGEMVMERTRNRIREGFYVDQLQLGTGPMMTATEVVQRTEERLKFMGPMLGRQQTEFLTPLIDRVFGIMLRKKMFAPIPRVLSNKRIPVHFSSPIARAQRSGEANALLRALASMVPMAQVQPEAMDILNAEAGFRYIARLFDLPQEFIRNEREVNAIRQGRMQAAEEQASAGAQMQNAEVANKAAPMVAAVANLQKTQASLGG